MGERLGRYLLERKLATGGMAEVFLATQAGPERFERRCVVKRLLPYLAEDPEFVGMFLDEARLAAQLDHPHIAPIFDFGQHERTYFIAMEYVAGTDLRTLIRDWTSRREWLPLPAAIRIASQAASALDYAHNAVGADGAPLRIVHRDVSPPNILVSASGMVKLIDFGIAKAAGDRQKTSAGVIKGKMAYMSPEQVLGTPLDARSDLFSLGLVMFELFTNAQAVNGDSHMDLFDRIVHGPLPPLRQFRPELPGELVSLVDRSLQLDRERRFASASQLATELERLLTNMGVTVTPGDLGQLVAPYRQQPSAPRIAIPIKPSFPAVVAETRVSRRNSVEPDGTWIKPAPPGVQDGGDEDVTTPAFPAQPETPAPPDTVRPSTVAVVPEAMPDVTAVVSPPLRNQTVTEKVRPVRRWVGLVLLVLLVAAGAFESQNPGVQATVRRWWTKLLHP
jgi:serine/threonine protein kinase